VSASAVLWVVRWVLCVLWVAVVEDVGFQGMGIVMDIGGLHIALSLYTFFFFLLLFRQVPRIVAYNECKNLNLTYFRLKDTTLY
jgi:hypothetical protein